jgi:hypothetical protein
MKYLYSQINLSHNNSDHQQWQGDLHIVTHTQCKRTELSLPSVAPSTLCIKNVVSRLLFAGFFIYSATTINGKLIPRLLNMEYGIFSETFENRENN